jgi:sugar lactone lactonase YvrE
MTCLVALVVGPVAVFGQANYTNPYTFSTIVGRPLTAGTNDGTGSAALFYFPDGIATDDAGNLYISDQYNFTVRKMTPTGSVTTLAGKAGTAGSVDGTNGTAQFNHPWGLARDNAGNLYVADQGNHTMRKMQPAGSNWVVTTMAGAPGIAGGADGTNGAARFNEPDGVTVDQNGSVYVADQGNHIIRKLALVGTNCVVTTVAGLAGAYGSVDGTNSAARFNKPTSVAAAGVHTLFVADFFNHTIRRLTLIGTNWVVTTVAGLAGTSGSTDGTNSAARFNEPNGVMVDVCGNLYVADYGNDSIRKMMPAGTNWVVTTLGGLAGIAGASNGTGNTARFNRPTFVAVNREGDLYVADRDNDIIRRGFLASGAPVILPWSSGFSNGTYGFNLTAAAGRQVIVEASTNLVNWVSIWTNTVGPGELPFTDLQSNEYLNRFYRAHSL